MIPSSRRAKALLDFLALGGWFEAANIQETDEALAAFAIFFEKCDPLAAACQEDDE